MHVDEFINLGSSVKYEDRPENEQYARWVLNHFRLSATLKYEFNEFMKNHKLFCIHKNEKYRVTGASRLGDVWLTKKFDQDTGYQARVNVDNIASWSKE